MKNPRTNHKRISLARNDGICQSIHQRMCHLPNYKNITPSQSTSKAQWNPQRTMGNNHNGFHHRPTKVNRIWQYPHSCRPSQQSNNTIPLSQDNHSRTNQPATSGQCLEMHGFSQGNYLRLRTTIHSTSHLRTLEKIRNQTETLHHLPPPNRWRVWKGQPRNWAIPMHLWKLPAEWLGLPPTHHRICT